MQQDTFISHLVELRERLLRMMLAVFVVLIFGTKKLRNIGADLGGAVRGFKDGMREGGDKAGEPATSPQVSAQTVEGEVKAKTETKA